MINYISSLVYSYACIDISMLRPALFLYIHMCVWDCHFCYDKTGKDSIFSRLHMCTTEICMMFYCHILKLVNTLTVCILIFHSWTPCFNASVLIVSIWNLCMHRSILKSLTSDRREMNIKCKMHRDCLFYYCYSFPCQ